MLNLYRENRIKSLKLKVSYIFFQEFCQSSDQEVGFIVSYATLTRHCRLVGSALYYLERNVQNHKARSRSTHAPVLITLTSCLLVWDLI
ncbi:hypothetical protein YC2023_094734 [Brassica napus]